MNALLTICGLAATCENRMAGMGQPGVCEAGECWLLIVFIALVCIAAAGIGFAVYYSFKAKHAVLAASQLKDADDQGQDTKKVESEAEKSETLYKQEMQRKDRVRALFKEIYSASKDDSGKYDKTIANDLLKLYTQIDEYDKTRIIKQNTDGAQG